MEKTPLISVKSTNGIQCVTNVLKNAGMQQKESSVCQNVKSSIHKNVATQTVLLSVPKKLSGVNVRKVLAVISLPMTQNVVPQNALQSAPTNAQLCGKNHVQVRRADQREYPNVGALRAAALSIMMSSLVLWLLRREIQVEKTRQVQCTVLWLAEILYFQCNYKCLVLLFTRL